MVYWGNTAHIAIERFDFVVNNICCVLRFLRVTSLYWHMRMSFHYTNGNLSRANEKINLLHI